MWQRQEIQKLLRKELTHTIWLRLPQTKANGLRTEKDSLRSAKVAEDASDTAKLIIHNNEQR